MYVCIFILRICARRRRSLNEAFLVKIANIIIITIINPRRACAERITVVVSCVCVCVSVCLPVRTRYSGSTHN